MKTYLKIILVVVILVSLGFFIRATDWSAILEAVQKVGFNFLLLLLTTAVSAWLGAMGWRYCLPKEGINISGWQFFWIRQMGENIAIVNPTSIIGGEATKIYMLRARGVDQRSALHSILLSRAMMIGSQLFLLLIAGIWFLSLGGHDFSWSGVPWQGLWAIPVLFLALILLLRTRFFRSRIRIIFKYLRVLNPYRKGRLFIRELWLELVVFYRDNRRSMFLAFLFCSLHWLVGSFEFYLILLFLGVKTTIAKALLVDMGVVVFKTAGGFVPGQIGVEEYGNKVMLAIIGIAGNTIWITASILRRARQLSWLLLGMSMYVLFFRKQQ